MAACDRLWTDRERRLANASKMLAAAAKAVSPASGDRKRKKSVCSGFR